MISAAKSSDNNEAIKVSPLGFPPPGEWVARGAGECGARAGILGPRPRLGERLPLRGGAGFAAVVAGEEQADIDDRDGRATRREGPGVLVDLTCRSRSLIRAPPVEYDGVSQILGISLKTERVNKHIMNRALKKITNLVKVPLKPACTHGDWNGVEARLGTSLPKDYKEFIEIFGCGKIGDLIIFSPFSSNDNLNLEKQVSKIRSWYEVVREHDEFEEALFRDPKMYLPFGHDGSGMEAHWWIRGRPNSWCVAIIAPVEMDMKGRLFKELTFSTFILAICEHRIHGKLLPRELYEDMTFVPLGQ